MSKSEEGSIRKETKKYKVMSLRAFVMLEFNVWIGQLTNYGSYLVAAKHQKINFIIFFSKRVVQLQILSSNLLQIFNKECKKISLKNKYISFQKGMAGTYRKQKDSKSVYFITKKNWRFFQRPCLLWLLEKNNFFN